MKRRVNIALPHVVQHLEILKILLLIQLEVKETSSLPHVHPQQVSGLFFDVRGEWKTCRHDGAAERCVPSAVFSRTDRLRDEF